MPSRSAWKRWTALELAFLQELVELCAGKTATFQPIPGLQRQIRSSVQLGPFCNDPVGQSGTFNVGDEIFDLEPIGGDNFFAQKVGLSGEVGLTAAVSPSSTLQSSQGHFCWPGV